MAYKKLSKRASSLSGWSEAAIFLTLFLILGGIVIANMNTKYSKNYDSTFTIGTNKTQQDFTNYQDTLNEGIKSGEQTSSGLGLSLTTIWFMSKAGITIVWTFLSGQWIPNSISLMGLGAAGTALGLFLQILYVISVGFIAIKLFMRVQKV
jgi:hypothetical protein